MSLILLSEEEFNADTVRNLKYNEQLRTVENIFNSFIKNVKENIDRDEWYIRFPDIETSDMLKNLLEVRGFVCKFSLDEDIIIVTLD